jgi:hypothetical protein
MKRVCIALLLIPLAVASCQTANEPVETPMAQTQGAASTDEAFVQTALARSGAATAAVPTATAAPIQTTSSNAAEEAEIRDLVEGFGKRLGAVSLQAPDAPQEMQKQYSELVSPTLLEMWMNDVAKAPGRMVSSPWPDRIEIATLTKEGSDRYVITGLVVEITSVEEVSGGSAAEIPVRLVVQKGQGGWTITDYAGGR